MIQFSGDPPEQIEKSLRWQDLGIYNPAKVLDEIADRSGLLVDADMLLRLGELAEAPAELITLDERKPKV